MWSGYNTVGRDERMDARTGKKIRLGRLFRPSSGRAIVVAYSHGLLMGPMEGMITLEEMRWRASALRAAEGLMVSPGMLGHLEEVFVGPDAPALVLHLDWQNFSRRVLAYPEGVSVALATVEEALAAGASAVMTYMFVGHADPHDEREEIERNARIARECERLGLPLIIEPRSAREKTHPEDRTDVGVLGMYVRVAAEVGADVVKCIYPGEGDAMARVVEGCPVPVLVAGGPRKETLREALEVAEVCVRVGCGGIMFGRNIYQAEDPRAALEAFQRVVHEGLSAQEALAKMQK